MFKITAKLLIALSLSIVLTASNVYGFHKVNMKETNQPTEWDGSKETKKEYETKSKKKYCALTSKGVLVPSQGDPIEDLTTGKQRINEATEKPEFETINTPKVKVSGYHLTESINLENRLLPSTPKLNFKGESEWENIKLVDLLKMYCLQDSKKDRPTSFKNSYLEEFYTQVALDSGFYKLKGDKKIGDYNKKILEGEFGENIFKNENGIIINNPNAVGYVPDFLIEKHKVIKAKIAKDTKKKLIKEEIKKGNNLWISDNKQNYVDQFSKKLNKYEIVITKLKEKRNKLSAELEELELLQENTKEQIEIAFDDLSNTSNQEIKDLKRQIREDKKTYLSGIEIEAFRVRFEKIEKIDFEKYKNYTNLKKLINQAKKSNNAAHFLGKEGWKIPGTELKLSQDKIGFIQEFQSFKNRSLGSGSDTDENNIDELNSDIVIQDSFITLYVSTPVTELVNLDIELGKKIPWGKYLIYFVIFLVLTGVVVFIFIQQDSLKRLKRENEEKVGSLKRDFDGRLRDTSDQIKSASKDARAQQSTHISVPEPIKEIPKTAEEITASQYDELVFEYKEALEDFSKVSVFKQKWHGLALSRKERQDGTKTILVSSTRAFGKAEIWCVTFSDNYFAFPGSSVKTNMATYMNLDFEKASRDFKGIFGISTGSSYSTEPAEIRRGGAGFVVEKAGNIVFPN
jgi:hypothetical protein